jgi:hypothetical protein
MRRRLRLFGWFFAPKDSGRTQPGGFFNPEDDQAVRCGPENAQERSLKQRENIEYSLVEGKRGADVDTTLFARPI